MRGWMAHTLTHTVSLAHTRINTEADAPMQRRHTASSRVTVHSDWEEDIWRYAACCYGAPWEENIHRKTHTYTWCSINPKENGAIAHPRIKRHAHVVYMHARSINHWSCPASRDRNEAAATFQSITASVSALGLFVFITQRLCLFLLFICFNYI